jgi:hypothetical protein
MHGDYFSFLLFSFSGEARALFGDENYEHARLHGEVPARLDAGHAWKTRRMRASAFADHGSISRHKLAGY